MAIYKRVQFRRAERKREGMALKIRLERNSSLNVQYLDIVLFCHYRNKDAYISVIQLDRNTEKCYIGIFSGY